MLNFLLIIFLFLITLVDYETRTIPDGLSLLGILLVLHYQSYTGGIGPALLGIDAGIGVVWAMNSLKLTGLGGGDAKTMALIGACFGWQAAVMTALFAWLIYLPFKYRIKQRTVAYSPYILAGFFMVKLWNAILYLKI